MKIQVILKNKSYMTLIKLSAALAGYVAVLFLLMSLVYNMIGTSWFAFLATVTNVISGIVCSKIASKISKGYGCFSLTPVRWYFFGALNFALLLDYTFFSRNLSGYTGSAWWGMVMLAFSSTIGVLVALIVLFVKLKDRYCSRCHLTNTMQYDHEEGRKETYGYEFKNHAPETKTAYGTYDVDRTIKIKYQTQGWQENLGLHRYTSYTSVYKCRRCGNTMNKYFSSKTKV